MTTRNCTLHALALHTAALVLPGATHLGEELPQLLVLVGAQHVVSGEDGGAGHAEDVVHVQHEVGEVGQREQRHHHLLPGRGRSVMSGV